MRGIETEFKVIRRKTGMSAEIEGMRAKTCGLSLNQGVKWGNH